MKTAEIRLLIDAGIAGQSWPMPGRSMMNLRFQVVTGQLTDTSRLKQIRRLIAQYRDHSARARAGGSKEGDK